MTNTWTELHGRFRQLEHDAVLNTSTARPQDITPHSSAGAAETLVASPASLEVHLIHVTEGIAQTLGLSGSGG